MFVTWEGGREVRRGRRGGLVNIHCTLKLMTSELYCSSVTIVKRLPDNEQLLKVVNPPVSLHCGVVGRLEKLLVGKSIVIVA